jgi:hypothetical protein
VSVVYSIGSAAKISFVQIPRPRDHASFNSGKDKQLHAGLPDGFLSDQKSQFGYILEDLGMENVVVYSGH